MHPKHFMNKCDSLNINLDPLYIHRLITLSQQIISSQPIVLTPHTPLKIFGDIHGQFSDLMAFFQLYGTPHEGNHKKDIQQFDYVFLGDFIDRGTHSLQTICMLLALKCIYPDQMHLIRGNHEDIEINCKFGFIEQCQQKIRCEVPQDVDSIYSRLNRLFEWLSIAAVVNNKILCVHGGIGRIQDIEQIHQVKRPLKVVQTIQDAQSQTVLDVLWSDPTGNSQQMGILPNNQRDASTQDTVKVKFGADRVHQFLQQNNLQMIIRAHECVPDGYESFAQGALYTIFSATDYCRRHKNAGTMLVVTRDYEIIPKLIYPSSNNVNNWIYDEETLSNRPPTPPRWRNNNQGINQIGSKAIAQMIPTDWFYFWLVILSITLIIVHLLLQPVEMCKRMISPKKIQQVQKNKKQIDGIYSFYLIQQFLLLHLIRYLIPQQQLMQQLSQFNKQIIGNIILYDDRQNQYNNTYHCSYLLDRLKQIIHYLPVYAIQFINFLNQKDHPLFKYFCEQFTKRLLKINSII